MLELPELFDNRFTEFIYGCTGRNQNGTQGNTNASKHPTEFFKAFFGTVGLVCGVFDLVSKSVRFLFRVLKFVAYTIDGFLVTLQLALHVIELGFRIVQLHRPLLRSAVVFAK